MREPRNGRAGSRTPGTTKREDIYKWIRGGSAQMKDILKLAEETWGGLWVVEADDLPKFDKQHMPLITEDE
eukprot:15507985-Heterocapsa_arctica.AAC.1